MVERTQLTPRSEMLSNRHPTDAVDATREPVLTSGHERALSAEHWLLSAARDVKTARVEWAKLGVAFVRCGGLFTAVRMPADWIEAAAGTDDAETISEFLAVAVQGGAVVADESRRFFYFLVPPSTAARWSVPGTACLGPDTYLGVPRPGTSRTSAGRVSGSYWSVEMDGAGGLCSAHAVAQLATHARYRLAESGTTVDVRDRDA
ncbi:hypothetical protein ACQPXT_13135 [Streptomyces sp. CA-100214]